MMLAVTFETWPLLIGAAAAAIPFALHLLSSVRARQVYFPTLRFLHLSMRKTARRRRIQHWLLLLVRSALLALLAVALAGPVTESVADLASRRERKCAAVLIIDNSLSMAARFHTGAPGDAEKPLTRFEKAKADTKALLLGANRPAAAAVVFTNLTPAKVEDGRRLPQPRLTENLETLVDEIKGAAGTATTEAEIANRLKQAVELLNLHHKYGEKAVYVFSDMQKTSFQDLAELKDLAKAGRIRLVFVGAAGRQTRNVTVAALKIRGRAVVGEELRVEAMLASSSAAEMTATARLIVNDEPIEEKDREVFLKPAGDEPSKAAADFTYTPKQSGPLAVEVVLAGRDDLAEDDRRSASLVIRGRSRVVVVAGPTGRSDPPGYAPAAALLLALQPFENVSEVWPIVLRPKEPVEAGKFTAADLRGMDAAFFCDVPEFTADQVAAVESFVRTGGTAALFLGPNVRAAAYNKLFAPAEADEGLLPGRLEDPVGQLEPNAGRQAFAKLETDHPLLAGLYKTPGEYPPVEVRRYFPVKIAAAGAEVPVRHAAATVDPAGDPLVVIRPFGRGRVILCTTSASPVWSNFCSRPIFLPMVVRMSLPPSAERLAGTAYAPGETVRIPARPDSGPGTAMVIVTLPNGKVERVKGQRGKDDLIFEFAKTAQLGKYDWSIEAAEPDEPGASGSFVVNPTEAECNLLPVKPEALRQALTARGVADVYVGSSLPTADTEAPKTPGPIRHKWWDVFLAAVIALLIVEAIAANRFRRHGEGRFAGQPGAPAAK